MTRPSSSDEAVLEAVGNEPPLGAELEYEGNDVFCAGCPHQGQASCRAASMHDCFHFH